MSLVTESMSSFSVATIEGYALKLVDLFISIPDIEIYICVNDIVIETLLFRFGWCPNLFIGFVFMLVFCFLCYAPATKSLEAY